MFELLTKLKELKDLPLPVKLILGTTTLGTALGSGSLIYSITHVFATASEAIKTLEGIDANIVSIAQSIQETAEILKESKKELLEMQIQVEQLKNLQTENKAEILNEVVSNNSLKSYITFDNLIKTAAIVCLIGVTLYVGHAAVISISQSANTNDLTSILDAINTTVNLTAKTVVKSAQVISEIKDNLNTANVDSAAFNLTTTSINLPSIGSEVANNSENTLKSLFDQYL